MLQEQATFLALKWLEMGGCQNSTQEALLQTLQRDRLLKGYAIYMLAIDNDEPLAQLLINLGADVVDSVHGFCNLVMTRAHAAQRL